VVQVSVACSLLNLYFRCFRLFLTAHSRPEFSTRRSILSTSRATSPTIRKSSFLLILIVVLTTVQDRTVIDRLTHVVSICFSIVTEAFQLCVQHIHQSRDPTLYQAVLTAYEQMSSALDIPLPIPLDLAQLDTKWLDQIIAKNQAERTKLEVELKTYSNNMIKESIRVCACFVLRFFLRH